MVSLPLEAFFSSVVVVAPVEVVVFSFGLLETLSGVLAGFAVVVVVAVVFVAVVFVAVVGVAPIPKGEVVGEGDAPG